MFTGIVRAGRYITSSFGIDRLDAPGDNRREVETSRLSSTVMSTEQSRTDATSRERSPDHQYTLSIDQAAELYAKAGHPRTLRVNKGKQIAELAKAASVNRSTIEKIEALIGVTEVFARRIFNVLAQWWPSLHLKADVEITTEPRKIQSPLGPSAQKKSPARGGA